VAGGLVGPKAEARMGAGLGGHRVGLRVERERRAGLAPGVGPDGQLGLAG
jgi:hypothetical protein